MSGSAPIALRYVQIVPTFTGGVKQIQAQLDPAVNQAAKSAGTNLSKGMAASLNLQNASLKIQNFGNALATAGGKLTDGFTKPALVATTAVTGLVGVLGFKRLVGIDTARGQFQGLGYDADAVMKQVDEGVTNTSLSMAEGASMAVSILSTGAIPLEGLEEQIKRVANVSAAYNVEAQHASYLLNNVLVKQKVTWGDLSQMQQNQIPIVSMLADHYGVTGDAIMEMAQNGEISIEAFNEVLDKNAGAAAEEYAKTWAGVTANIRANIGRLGALVLDEVFPQMKEAAEDFLGWLRSDEAKNLAADLGAKLGEMARNVADGLRRMAEWWQNLSPGMQGFIVKATGILVVAGPVLVLLSKAVGVIATLVAGISGAIRVVTTITTAVKGLWAVMSANPLGLIITAIAAVVAALTWFFTQTETGRNLWAKFMESIKKAWEKYGKPAWEAIKKLAQNLWNNILKPIWTAMQDAWKRLWKSVSQWWEDTGKPTWENIKTVASWLWDHILKPIFRAIGIAWGLLWEGISWAWDHVGKPIWDAVSAVATWLWDHILKPIFTWIGDHWEDIWNAISWVWDNVGRPLWDAVSAAATWLWENVLEPVFTWIGDHWEEMVDVMVGAYEWLDEHVIQPMAAAFEWLSDTVGGYFSQVETNWKRAVGSVHTGAQNIETQSLPIVVRAAASMSTAYVRARDSIATTWKQLQTVLRTGWLWISSNVFDPMKTGLNAIHLAFDSAKKMIDRSWSEIRRIAAAPINFVIETVYMNGLKRFVELVADKLGFSISLPSVSPIKYAGGGLVPGYAPGVDSVLALLSPGEGILVPEAVRGLGPSFIGWANSFFSGGRSGGGFGIASSSGGCGGGSCGLPGFSEGGIVGWFSDAARGLGAFIRDPLAAVAELITRPVEQLLGGVASNVWGDLGRGGINTILSAVPDWFKEKSKTLGNAGLVGAAMQALGVPYVWGGSSIPPGLDCSGLVYWAAQQLGLGWPRLTAAGYQSASVSKGMANAVPGDLLFWGSPAHHVAIYTGPGQMIHAPQPGSNVTMAGIYGAPGVGTYGGGGGAGMTSTYAGLVSTAAASATSAAQFAQNLRTRQYDSGGMLEPGWTLAFNDTGEPEPILTGAKWRELLGSRSGQRSMVIRSGEVDFTADGKLRIVDWVLEESGLSELSDGRIMSKVGVG